MYICHPTAPLLTRWFRKLSRIHKLSCASEVQTSTRPDAAITAEVLSCLPHLLPFADLSWAERGLQRQSKGELPKDAWSWTVFMASCIATVPENGRQSS
jgi:hypothetical protein